LRKLFTSDGTSYHEFTVCNYFQALISFQDLLHSLIQTSGERKEAELAQDGSHTKAATFKQNELTKCAQRMARFVKISDTLSYRHWRL